LNLLCHFFGLFLGRLSPSPPASPLPDVLSPFLLLFLWPECVAVLTYFLSQHVFLLPPGSIRTPPFLPVRRFPPKYTPAFRHFFPRHPGTLFYIPEINYFSFSSSEVSPPLMLELRALSRLNVLLLNVINPTLPTRPWMSSAGSFHRDTTSPKKRTEQATLPIPLEGAGQLLGGWASVGCPIFFVPRTGLFMVCTPSPLLPLLVPPALSRLKYVSKRRLVSTTMELLLKFFVRLPRSSSAAESDGVYWH